MVYSVWYVCAWYGSTQVNVVMDGPQCIVLKRPVVCSVRRLPAGGVHSVDCQASLLFGQFSSWKGKNSDMSTSQNTLAKQDNGSRCG